MKKHDSDQHRSEWSTMLDCIRPVSLDIWHVERSVCVWSSWLNTSSSTAVIFTAVRACFGLPLPYVPLVGASCFQIFFSTLFSHSFFSVLLRKFRQYPLWTVGLFNALSLALNSASHYLYFATILNIIIYNSTAFGFNYRHRKYI